MFSSQLIYIESTHRFGQHSWPTSTYASAGQYQIIPTKLLKSSNRPSFYWWISELKWFPHNLYTSKLHISLANIADRHLLTRLQDNIKSSQPVGKQTRLCGVSIISNKENLSILQSTNRNLVYLMTLAALWIREIKPKINIKDEYEICELTIKLWVAMFINLNFTFAFVTTGAHLGWVGGSTPLP